MPIPRGRNTAQGAPRQTVRQVVFLGVFRPSGNYRRQHGSICYPLGVACRLQFAAFANCARHQRIVGLEILNASRNVDLEQFRSFKFQVVD